MDPADPVAVARAAADPAAMVSAADLRAAVHHPKANDSRKAHEAETISPYARQRGWSQ